MKESSITANCWACGSELDINDDDTDAWGDRFLIIRPCNTCLSELENEILRLEEALGD